MPSPGYAQLCVVWDQRDRQAERREGKRRQGDGGECPLPPLCLRFELLPVAVVATAPADGGGVEWSGRAGQGMAWHGRVWCAVVVEVVRIFVSHSNLYQSCVRNDG